MCLRIFLKFLEISSKYVLVWVKGFFCGFVLIVLNFSSGKKVTSAKKCQRDRMILLFTLAITSAFAEC